jgi:hypothetical protein
MPSKDKKRRSDKPAAEREQSSVEEGHLANIEKLLNATYDLMRQEPTLDRSAFENLRQLRVKVRFASSATWRSNSAIPNVAPRLWEQRTEEMSPLRFLAQAYEEPLRLGIISRADIRRLDKQLYLALYSWKITSEELDRIGLPTKKALNSKKLAAAGSLKRPSQSLKVAELPPAERERARLWSVARRRKERRSEE